MRIRLPKKRRYRVYIYIACTLMILLAVDLIWVRIWRHITVGYDTTRITGPLKADGMPDYIRAINERASQGVTPENNAAILLLQAVGPVVQSPRMIPEVYSILSMPPMPERGDYFQSYWAFKKTKNPAQEPDGDALGYEFDRLVMAPWRAAEHAEAAQWLQQQGHPLALLQEAGERSRYFVPLIPNASGTLASCTGPSLGAWRELTRTAICRAMLEIQEGRFGQARADILACHRVARLIAQSPTLIGYLVALAIDRTALAAEKVLAASATSALELQQHVKDVDALGQFPTLVASMDMARYEVLDSLIFASRNIAEAQRLASRDPTTFWEALLGGSSVRIVGATYFHLRPAHFNAALRDANAFYDRQLEVMKIPSYQEREDQRRKWEREMEDYERKYDSAWSDPAKRLMVRMFGWFDRVSELADDRAMDAGISRLALALALYHRETGGYPETLAALSPRYIGAIPADLFVDGQLHYQRSADGYLLYSVGPNGKDDGGQARDNQHRTADDIAARVPLAPLGS